MLLDHPNINDTIRDEQGRTALECAANADVSSVIEREAAGKPYANPS